MANVVVAQAPQLRAVESFIQGYRPVTAEDLRNLDRLPYEDWLRRLREDPVALMVEASDVGMDLSQHGNFVSPQTRVEQGRSIINRAMEDEGIYARQTDMSAPSTVSECMDGAHRQAILFHILTKVWERNSIRDRNSIQLPTSSPQGTPPNTETFSQPPPLPVGLRLNPGELVATTHTVDTNNYNPFKWVYDKEDMQRSKVQPAETIPASTLSESAGSIPMEKWGNRFVLPREMLVRGQGMRINKLASMIALDASTESSREFVELLGVLENGDGAELDDSGVDKTKAVVEGITEYGGTAGTFGFIEFLNWLDEALEAPFQISHVIMLKKQQRDLRSAVSALQGNLAFEQLSSVGLAPNGMANMEGQGTVRYGRAPDGAISDNIVLGLDNRYAVEKVNRAGMTVRQQAENIANQTRDIVISDTSLWARLSPAAVKALDVSK